MNGKEAGLPLGELLRQYPYLSVWLDDLEVPLDPALSFRDNMEHLPESFFEQRKTEKETLETEFSEYLSEAAAIFSDVPEPVREITILPGTAKDGTEESFRKISVRAGEIIAIVGETGSGKSRLLEDIEWQADGDTPTGRRILIDGRRKDAAQDGNRQRIAQLSQNMNFVLDMNVREFLTMHAECFAVGEAAAEQVRMVYETAQTLCGEPFSPETSVTSLSGGQSRALMIADCAVISRAPVILIDEIENAGIDRRRALKLLTGHEKVVFIATHDPVLSLMADRRLVIRNGGISAVIEKNEAERTVLQEAEALDRRLTELRNLIRSGKELCGGTRPAACVPAAGGRLPSEI